MSGTWCLKLVHLVVLIRNDTGSGMQSKDPATAIRLRAELLSEQLSVDAFVTYGGALDSTSYKHTVEQLFAHNSKHEYMSQKLLKQLGSTQCKCFNALISIVANEFVS